MALRGYFPVEELATFDAAGSRLQGHPDMTSLPGLDASTGSLGQGLSVGVGIALGARRRGLDSHTFVLLGDGEMQEGQVWESLPVAARYGLGNLTAIVDRNGLQQYGWPLRPGEAHRGDRRDPGRGSTCRPPSGPSAGGCSRSTVTTSTRSWTRLADARAAGPATDRRRSWPGRSRVAASRSPKAPPNGTAAWRPPTRRKPPASSSGRGPGRA